MKTKILLAVLLLTFVFCFAGKALAMTESERQALITQIQQEITRLTQQVTQLIALQQGNTAWCHDFDNNLGYANSGTAEIVDLHTALQREGISYSPDAGVVYSTGTSEAVKQFQIKYGISPQSGYVAVLTRTKLNQLYGCETNDDDNNNVVNPTIDYCTEDNWTYSVSPSACPSSGTQTKTWTKIGTCAGGINHSATETLSCTYTPSVSACTSFAYTDWSACNSSRVKTRTVTSSYPSGCVGGNQVTSQACTYTPLTATCTESNWTYSVSPSACPSSGTQTKTWTKIGTCAGGISHSATETLSCTYTPSVSACTSFAYTDWSACNSSGVKTRTVTSSYPSGCVGGNQVTSQACTYLSATIPTITITANGLACPEFGCVQNIPIPSTRRILLSWQATNATSCSASGDWLGTKDISGSQEISVDSAHMKSLYTFYISCAGSGGSKVNSVRVGTGTGGTWDPGEGDDGSTVYTPPEPPPVTPSCVGPIYQVYSVSGGNVQCTSNSQCPAYYPCTASSVIWPNCGTPSYAPNYCAKTDAISGRNCSTNTDCGTGYYCSCNYMNPSTYEYICNVAPSYFSKQCFKSISGGSGSSCLAACTYANSTWYAVDCAGKSTGCGFIGDQSSRYVYNTDGSYTVYYGQNGNGCEVTYNNGATGAKCWNVSQ